MSDTAAAKASAKAGTREKAKTLATYAGAAVPGLSVFIKSFGTPDDERFVFAIALEIVAFVVLARVHLSRDEIKGWTPDKTKRVIAVLGVLTLVLVLSSMFAVGERVASYSYHSSGDTLAAGSQSRRDEEATRAQPASRILVPVGIARWKAAELDRALACRRIEGICRADTPVPAEYGAAEIGEALSRFGQGLAVHVPSSGSRWLIALTILVALYAATTGTMIGMYAVAIVRRVDPKTLAEVFFKSDDARQEPAQTQSSADQVAAGQGAARRPDT